MAQQQNIALVAALLLTVQFTFAYSLPQIWDPIINPDDTSASYLLSLMTEDQTNYVHEVATESHVHLGHCNRLLVQAFIITIGVSLVINCMTVFYCVLVVLILGELNGALLRSRT